MTKSQVNPLRIAVVQISAGADAQANLRRVNDLLKDLGKTDLIALPEVFAFRGSDKEYRSSAEPIDGEIVSQMADMAREKKAWVLAGSVIERAGTEVYNTCVVLNRAGEVPWPTCIT